MLTVCDRPVASSQRHNDKWFAVSLRTSRADLLFGASIANSTNGGNKPHVSGPRYGVSQPEDEMLQPGEALLRYAEANNRDEERRQEPIRELKNATTDFADGVERCVCLGG
jgi:hypothetical protein